MREKREMRFRIFLGTVFALLLLAGAAFAVEPAPAGEYIEGEALVILEGPTGLSAAGAAAFEASLTASANSVAASVGAQAIRTYGAIATASGKNIVHLRAEGKSTEELLAELGKNTTVLGASPNYVVKISGTPNDPRYGELWGLSRIGAPEAWDVSTGSTDIIVAVIDTGIDRNHPDLSANIVKDLDGKWGKDTFNNDDDPMDGHGHGTHVAGTIGAVGNNSLGVSGVNWQVGLLGVKVLSDTGSGSWSSVIAGINYVTGQRQRGLNVRVANMSLGGWSSPVGSNDPFYVACKALSDAGILNVVAAGNEAQNIDNPSGSYSGLLPYPAAFSASIDGMLSIAAIASDTRMSSFSNYGSTYVQLAAPGSGILSTVLRNGYASWNGTSMATPHVAGAAALIAAARPGESAAQIKQRILSNAASNSYLTGKVSTGGHLNLAAAIGGGSVDTGSVRVTIDGPAEARWSLNGTGSYASGATVSGVPAGSAVVSFSAVSGWNRPANITVSVTKGTTVDATGTYTRQIQDTGSVRATIKGPAEARWSVNGNGAYKSGATVSGVPVGNAVVSFTAVPGWDKPADRSVTVKKSTTVATSGTYIRQTGSVRVTISGPATARWSLNGKGSYKSGATVSGVPVGNAVVSFFNVSGWNKPANITLAVTKGATATAAGTYTQHTGFVRVTISSPGDARWSVNGMGDYRSGETSPGIPAGKAVVSFTSVSGWDKPANISVTVKNGTTAAAKGTYKQHAGSVRVTIKGPAGARWSLDGKGSYKSGTTVSKVPAGNLVVSFSNVAGWNKPANISVAVRKGARATTNGIYTVLKSSELGQETADPLAVLELTKEELESLPDFDGFSPAKPLPYSLETEEVEQRELDEQEKESVAVELSEILAYDAEGNAAEAIIIDTLGFKIEAEGETAGRFVPVRMTFAIFDDTLDGIDEKIRGRIEKEIQSGRSLADALLDEIHIFKTIPVDGSNRHFSLAEIVHNTGFAPKDFFTVERQSESYMLSFDLLVFDGRTGELSGLVRAIKGGRFVVFDGAEDGQYVDPVVLAVAGPLGEESARNGGAGCTTAPGSGAGALLLLLPPALAIIRRKYRS